MGPGAIFQSVKARPIRNMMLVNRVQEDSGFLISRKRSLQMKRVEPLGLEYLVAVLKRAGRQGTLLDEALRPEDVDALPQTVAAAGVDAVGFYTNDGITRTVCNDIRRLREAGCDLPILIGGPAASAPKVFLEAGADMAVIGEGEVSLLEVVDWLEGSREKSSLRGVAWLEEGEVHFAPEQVLIQDLDTLPYPDRSHAGIYDYYDRWYPVSRQPFASAMFARGCPYRCTFCSSPFHWGKKTRQRSVESALDEMEHMARERQVRFVAFKDDIFGINPDWLLAFCDGMIQRQIPIRWAANFEPRSAQRDPYGILAKMRQAGCAAIAIGLQAVEPDTLRKVSRRPNDPEYVEHLIRAARQNDILAVVELIFGLPDSTWEADQMALDWALKTRPHLTGIYSLMQIPGSPILEQYQGGEVSPHQTEAQAREHARQASRRIYRDPRHLAQFVRLIARENPRWFLQVARQIPAVLDRVGVNVPV